jgi:hypothetical protein
VDWIDLGQDWGKWCCCCEHGDEHAVPSLAARSVSCVRCWGRSAAHDVSMEPAA